jgi:GH24 family phage-related lysozyme (muramidase)
MEQTQYTTRVGKANSFDDPNMQRMDDLLYNTKSVGYSDVPSYFSALEKELMDKEGFRHRTYTPTQGDRDTIGYGHTGQYATPNNYITKQEGRAILKKDVQDKHNQIISEFPEFKGYSDDIKVPIASSKFRGSFGSKASPETIKLIRQGKYDEAGDEFLNHDEYNKAKAGLNDRAGIIPRMEKTSYAIKRIGTGLHPNMR